MIKCKKVLNLGMLQLCYNSNNLIINLCQSLRFSIFAPSFPARPELVLVRALEVQSGEKQNENNTIWKQFENNVKP